MEERIGLLCLGPDMAVGVKDARLLQENLRQYACSRKFFTSKFYYICVFICTCFCVLYDGDPS